MSYANSYQQNFYSEVFNKNKPALDIKNIPKSPGRQYG